MYSINDKQITTFVVGKEIFGVGIQSIKEIVRYPYITEVPRVPNYIKGLANLRGTIMPVIETRGKLNLPETEITDQTRVIVLDTGNVPTGIVVDRVKGVKDIENLTIEEPPSIISTELDIDKKYISGIIQSDEEIIMLISIESLCDIDIKEIQRQKEKENIQSTAVEDTAIEKEKQLITFIINTEEYAFPIESVREILRVTSITSVPEVPKYVLGILSVRNSILPIIDIRRLFGLASLEEKIINEMTEIAMRWINLFESPSDYNLSGTNLTSWIDNFRTSSVLIGRELQILKSKCLTISEAAKKGIAKDDQEKLKAGFLNQVESLKNAIQEDIKEDQRILVLEINGTPIGMLVDRMKQVIRVPERLIESSSSVLKTNQMNSISAIAKLNEGKRLIMLLNENNLFDKTTLDGFKKIGKEEKSVASENISFKEEEELQFVTFKLDKIEFAITINDVQEINRLDNITSVPRAPQFVEGIMNLRGNVIPVINLRTKLDMPKKQYDETTRVIIVNLNGSLTGFVVDAVTEVLRTNKKSLEVTPAVIEQNLDMNFIQSICKLQNRMLLIINTTKLLSAVEQAQLNSFANADISNYQGDQQTILENHPDEIGKDAEFTANSNLDIVPKKKSLKKIRDKDNEN